MSFGSTWLARQLGDFLDEYPDINVQLVLADHDVDLAKREADVAIRFHPPFQAELMQKPLFPIRHYLCASAEYLERHGVPQTVADLEPAPADRLWRCGAGVPEGHQLGAGTGP